MKTPGSTAFAAAETGTLLPAGPVWRPATNTIQLLMDTASDLELQKQVNEKDPEVPLEGMISNIRHYFLIFV